MIKQLFRSTIFAAAIACAGGAFAQITQINGDTHSAVRDESNVAFNTTNWELNLQTAAADVPLFINSMVITGGGVYNPLINMQAQSSGFDFGDVNGGPGGHYSFGDAITGDNNWNFAGAFHNGVVDAAVADGVYDFSLGIMGGADNGANNVLASFNLHVDIAQKLDIFTSMVANPVTIREGADPTTVNMTVTNNMASRDFITSTWYYFLPGFNDGLGNSLPNGDFAGNWFDQVIAPGGGSHTDAHSIWHADLNTPIGTYTGGLGVVGGLDHNDGFFMRTDQQATINVIVPEPASFAVLGIGAIALIRRRRKK